MKLETSLDELDKNINRLERRKGASAVENPVSPSKRVMEEMSRDDKGRGQLLDL